MTGLITVDTRDVFWSAGTIVLAATVCAVVLTIGCTRQNDRNPATPSPLPTEITNSGTPISSPEAPTPRIEPTSAADDHVTVAWELFERGDYRDAIDEARLAVMADPGSAAALHVRGYLAYIVDGSREGALSDLRKASELDPDNPEIILDALQLQVSTRWGAQFRALLDTAEQNADPFEFRMVLAILDARAGQYEVARRQVGAALGVASSDIQRNRALELRGWYEIQQGRYNNALVTYQSVHKDAPAPTAEMGELLARWLSGERESVRDDLVAQLDPHGLTPDPDSAIKRRLSPVLGEMVSRVELELRQDVLDRAEAAWEESGYQAAIAVLEDADRGASFPPTTGEALWSQRGDVYMEAGRFELAVASYTRALEYNQSSPWPRAARAAALLELGQLEDALADAVRSPTFSDTPPSNRPDLQELTDAAILGCLVEAQVRYAQGREEIGDFAFTSCANQAALLDRRAEVLAMQSRTQLEHGYVDQAVSTAELAIESVNGDSIESAYGAYGAALVVAGRFDDAVTAYERATRPIDYGDRVSPRRPYVERLVLLELMGDEDAAVLYAGLLENLDAYVDQRAPLDYVRELVTSYRAGVEAWFEAGLAAQADEN